MGELKFDVTMTVTEKGRKAPKYTLESDSKGQVSLKEFLEWQRQTLITVALEVLKEEQDKGFTRKPVVAVDNRKNKNVTDVNAFGKIEFFSQVSGTKLIELTYKHIMRTSKVVTGQYKASHRVLLNKQIVADSETSFNKWIASNPVLNENDEVVFINLAPYARRLERLGVTAQRQQNRKVNYRGKDKNATKPKVLAPNGVYYLAYRAVGRKFKNHARITFRMVSGDRYGISGKFKRQGKGKQSAGRSYLYPAIMIKFTDPGAME